MKIGVSGASGQLGSATLRFLRERVPADQLVGISRTPDTVSATGLESRFGDTDGVRKYFSGTVIAGRDFLEF